MPADASSPMAGGRSERGPLGDDAVSDVLGELLMIAVIVGLFAVASIAFVPADPPVDLHAEVQTRLACGAGGWGTGDERVVVEHAGGDALARDRTGIEVLADGTATDYAVGTLGGPFSDGALGVGERWNHTQAIPAGAEVRVRVFYLHDDGAVELWHDAPVMGRACATG